MGDAKTFGGETALHFAASKNDLRAVQMLLGKNANLEAKNCEGNTALHLAVGESEYYWSEYYWPFPYCYHFRKRGESVSELVATFIEKGADLNAKNERGETALHLAETNADTETVELLVEKGADLEARNESGERARHLINKENERLRKVNEEN